MPPHGDERVRTSYDTVADAYADAYADAVADHLARDADDRADLADLAGRVLAGGGGQVLDAGCGPGHVTAHLHALGLDVVGVDLSPGMVERARRDHPDLAFSVGSFCDLDVPTASLAGALAWYSLVHASDAEVGTALAELSRVVRPGGWLLVGVHVGDRVSRKTSGYGGLPMDVAVHRRPLPTMSAWLAEAGFGVERSDVRGPVGARHGRLLGRRSRPGHLPSPAR